MPLNEYWLAFKSSSYFYLVIILVLIVLLLIFSRMNRKKKLQKRIDEASVKINDLKSHPFSVDIAKLDALARKNESIKPTAANCKVDFDLIQNNMKKAVSLLTDANECIQTSNFKLCESKVGEIEPLLKETKEITGKLDDVLAAILNQSAMQRKHINQLKSDFHDIKSMVNLNPGNYTFAWESLDGITNEISHQFSDFEAMMDASKYDEAAEKAEEIKEAISHLDGLVQQLPELINTGKTTVPNAINELYANYKVASDSGVFLNHLEIPEGIDSINESLNECLSNIKNCNIEGVSSQLSSCLGRVNQYNGSLTEEKATYRDLVAIKDEIGATLDQILNIINNVNETQYEYFERYNLSSLQQQFNEVIGGYENNIHGYASLSETFDSNSIPATTLIISFDELKIDVDDLLANAQAVTTKLTNSITEETRVRGLVSRFIVVLNESKASIRLSRLPSVSKKYDEDIVLAEHYINELNDLLSTEIIDIDAVTATVNKAQKVIISLYKNVNNLIDTTNDLENYIILCNKYRPYYPELDSSLYSAELAYRNGEYTKACKLTAGALEKIDPSLANELIEGINKRLTLQKEA